MSILLEVCVDDATGLDAAIAGGADRIELCSALALGGLTPSPGLMARAARAAIPVYAMIRPRPGDFVYDAADCAVMLDDIRAVASYGLAGVVLGASLCDGRLDHDTLARLIAAAGRLGKTLHRAFDLVPAPLPALETAVALGFERILSSGGAATAAAGIAGLRAAIEAAAGRIAIMPGSGVTAANVADLVAATGAREVHASCSVATPSPNAQAIAFGFASPTERRTDRATVRTLKTTLVGLV